MNYKFIPVNNNLDKARAFANSLDNNFITNVQKIKQKDFYIPTLDVVQKLQTEGWELKGVDEARAKNRKITNNYVQMHHPDFAVKNSKGQDEAIASLTISNSCSGNKPLQLDLGAYREVCSNGLVAFDAASESSKIQHTKINARDLDLFIHELSNKSNKLIKEINAMKDKNMSYDEIRSFAYNAAKLRFNEDDDKFDVDALLKVNRVEDESNDVWTVFNRIQENLTHDVKSKEEDIKLNKYLYELVNREMAYA
jgi:hypothetical protein